MRDISFLYFLFLKFLYLFSALDLADYLSDYLYPFNGPFSRTT